ncbi:MAG TPA: hypothetical protein EYP62_05145 [Kiritimatiellae bacterium]|nr:hypothetical protein [Kiritimatiellia bacterium]
MTDRRKLDHVRLALRDPGTDRMRHHFDRLVLRHRALPEINLESVDTSVQLFGRRLSFPLIIASMTGGSPRRLQRVNRNLARAAQRCGVGMGVGSQRVMFTHRTARDSFRLREVAPDTLLLANLGAGSVRLGDRRRAVRLRALRGRNGRHADVGLLARCVLSRFCFGQSSQPRKFQHLHLFGGGLVPLFQLRVPVHGHDQVRSGVLALDRARARSRQDERRLTDRILVDPFADQREQSTSPAENREDHRLVELPQVRLSPQQQLDEHFFGWILARDPQD